MQAAGVVVTVNKGLFSSASIHWATPKALYQELDEEFHFNDDPCPLQAAEDGLNRAWGTRTYLNPPYGRLISRWLAKAYLESLEGKLVVCLIPSRTDTRWFHEYVMKAKEIRFLKGRLNYSDLKDPNCRAPFPSAIVVFGDSGT